MHIILDANVYAADYKLSGVAFKTLFDYMRRTNSKLVLPRIIREEVVVGYGRRLKKESKEFGAAIRRYQLVSLDEPEKFIKPNIRYEMRKLRKKLMNPGESVRPLYLEATEGVSIEDVFLRGIHRRRPASDSGEELRDVVIWLWACAYSDSVEDRVSFISGDNGFWVDDVPHPDLASEIEDHHLSIYKSIEDFIKENAPAPAQITPEWFSANMKREYFENDLLRAADVELNRILQGPVRDVHLDSLGLKEGAVYDVARGVQFVEVEVSAGLRFTYLDDWKPEPPSGLIWSQKASLPAFGPLWGTGFQSVLSGPIKYRVGVATPSPLFGNLSLSAQLGPVETVPREMRAMLDARFSARIKDTALEQITLDEISIDRRELYSLLTRERSETRKSGAQERSTPAQ